MRKLLFFSVAMSSLLSMNAQREIQVLEPVPAQKSSIEKEMNVLFAPKKDVSVSNSYNDYNTQKHVHKARYTHVGNIVSAAFAGKNLDNLEVGYGIFLFPDSLAARYEIDIHDSNKNEKDWATFASTGFSFDPYSRSFDADGIDQFGMMAYKIDENTNRYFYQRERDKGIATFYGYKVDTISMYVDYRMPNGYNPSSKDTLRLHITSYGVYKGADAGDFQAFKWSSEDGRSIYTFSPSIVYPSPIPDKGVGPVMKSGRKMVVDYPLTDKDTLDTKPGPGYIRGKAIRVGINNGNGYTVPAGHVLCVVAQYIPAFDYSPRVPSSIVTRTYSFPRDTFFRAGDIFRTGNDSIVFEHDTLIIASQDTLCFVKGDGIREADTLFFSDTMICFPDDGGDTAICFPKNNKFILGYDTTGYVYYNDTLSILTVNSALPVPAKYVKQEDRLNTFHICGWEMDTTNKDYFFDAKGLNTSFLETYGVRYRHAERWSDSVALFEDPIAYNVFYYMSGAFFLNLYIDEDDTHTTSVVKHKGNLISKVYPNPANSKLTIDLKEAGNAKVTVCNILGQAIIEETLNDISNTINIAELSSGLYFVKVDQNGRSHTVKISKE
jgi:hypothetical protein